MFKDWRRFFALWGWALLAALGIALAFLGIGLGVERGFGDPWSSTTLSFGQAILVAGVIAAVMRAFQSAGFFRDQLREIIYQDAFDDSLIDLKKAWRQLTRGLFNQRFAALTEQNMQTLDFESLVGTADYFYSKHWRKIEFRWSDKAAGLVEVTETVSLDLHTAQIGRDVEFKNVYSPDAATSERKPPTYQFEGEGFSRTLGKDDVVLLSDGREQVSTTLPPGAKLSLIRSTTKVQHLAGDPFLNFRSNCLWNCPEVHIRSNEPDLSFYFRPMGMTGSFKSKDGKRIDGLLKELNAQYEALCLPGQGYMIVIVRQ